MSNENRASGRQRLLKRARSFLGAHVGPEWDWRQGKLSTIDIVPFAAGRRLQAAMKYDFSKDAAGYRKMGGLANTPEAPYFYRRYANLLHYLRRADGFHARGSQAPLPGMILVLDWPEHRGRFNFSPDRLGVVMAVEDDRVSKAIMALPAPAGWVVAEVRILPNSPSDRLVIGYGDLPNENID